MTVSFDGLYSSRPRTTQLPGVPFEHFPAITDTLIGEIHCATTSIDVHGRLGERSAIRSLGWLPGQRIDIESHECIAVIRSLQEGSSSIGPHGYLHLPAAIRYACNLSRGDRVLMVAALSHEQLVVYPMASLAAALWRYRAELWSPAR